MSDEELRRLIRMPWLTVPECAAYLNKTKRSIQGLLRRGIIPPRRLGKTIYVDRVALDEQIRRSCDGRRLRRMRR